MTRLGHARDAIGYVKGILQHGAGNQIPALQDSRFNSALRLDVARKEKYWTLTPEAQVIAKENDAAYRAARAELAEGGNCGEHANLAYQYLRWRAVGETISRGSVDGFDHAFTFVGPAGNTTDMSETAVADPWPTDPKAVLWEDHFAKPVMDAGQNLNVSGQMTADGGNPKDLIKAGLSLTAEGQQRIEAQFSEAKTEERIEKHENDRQEKTKLENELRQLKDEAEQLRDGLENNSLSISKRQAKKRLSKIAKLVQTKRKRLKNIKIWMWEQEDAHEDGRDFDYVEAQEPTFVDKLWAWLQSWVE